MIVCHCNGVSDRAIRRIVRAGAVTTELVARECGAGAGCGGCRASVRAILRQHVETAREREASVSVSLSAEAVPT